MTLAHKSVAAALLVAATLGMAGCNSGEKTAGPSATPKDTKIHKAWQTCDPTSTTVELADGNRSLLINGAGTNDLTDVACLLLNLDTPQYIVSEMDSTTSMMGRQKEEDGGISYDWSYHPDNGLDMIIHEDDD